VFGEGPPDAELVVVGEQPGDAEDLAGRPFVGPAGQLLDRALAEAGIDRRRVYVTNAVKHYKWEPRGKRRLHAKPSAREVGACAPWLAAELAAVGPKLVVCLGATAAQALLGKAFRVTRQRGQVLTLPGGGSALATLHPSALLRMQDDAEREAEFARLVADLKRAAVVLRAT
jgi:uracil-DNA glycosylase